MAQKDIGVTVGGTCTVTSGPNKGKTGTYTVDEQGDIWCEGDWGGTQCAGSKCKSGAASHGTIFEYPGPDGQPIYEVDGLYEIEGKGVFRFRAKLDATTGVSRDAAAVPVAVTHVSTLQESGSDFDAMLAKAIVSYTETRDQRLRDDA
jgi:hypothetical protein